MRSFARQFFLVFGLWTAVALCNAAADYALLHLLGRSPTLAQVLARPLTEQWIWAALTPIVFALVRRFPLARPRLGRALALHFAFFFALSMLHSAIAQLVGGPVMVVPAHYEGSILLLRFLEELYSDIWMYWPLACISALIESHARERRRERQAMRLEQSMADMRLALLRAQIQPHFLFNTMHAISALMRVDPRAAEDMLVDLAEILRTGFAEGIAQETALGRELGVVECYLRIQQRRFGERLQVRLDIDPAALPAAVPALVLQSIVENAVVHGLAPRPQRGTLEIRARRDGERLAIAVEDDGAGMPAGPPQGVGLANARERIGQLYGEAGRFDVASAPGRGTCVTLQIPYRPFTGADDEDPYADRRRRAAGAAQPVVAAGA